MMNSHNKEYEVHPLQDVCFDAALIRRYGRRRPRYTSNPTALQISLKGQLLLRSIMTEKVCTVPEYDDVSIAARVTRNHNIHRVVVTHEKSVVGMLSTFDLLTLVDGHRCVAKYAPTKSKRKGSKRA